MGGRSGKLLDCGDVLGVDEEGVLSLRVLYSAEPSDESTGARLTGYKVDDELSIKDMLPKNGYETLNQRARSSSSGSRLWPSSYRGKAFRHSWQADVLLNDKEQKCILLIASKPEERTEANAVAEVQDAMDAATYAHRFNLHQKAHADSPDQITRISVAIPVVCQVTATSYPSMVPEDSIVTLLPYPWSSVQKYVFDGQSEEMFMEIPQTFFHYAAFSSNGKHFVCDIQGAEDSGGDIVLVDPCVLRTEPPSITGLVGKAAKVSLPAAATEALASDKPTLERFDCMHPKCSQLCKTFDAQRQTAKRNAGMCGVGTCGF
eukprot:TRINITY_DN26729_c0_g1_i1.p1 TRINITY_DN26729_c0_g1~~TRINITY_DN26729_c0_g1_i1.p1  ORF type:complete len:318 (-),score=72.04 TRINITY_DN26729_c0_g1_i1:86-1039(-)